MSGSRLSGAGPDRGRGRGCLRRLAWTAGGFVLLLLVLRLAGPSILEAYARWLIVEDPLPTREAPADAVVALSGADGERLMAALEIFREGRARNLLIVGPDKPLLKVYSGEDSLTQGEVKRRIAIRRGVPPEAALLALGAQSTWDEAHDVRETAARLGWTSVIVVTDPFHSRRARAVFRATFHDSPVRIAFHHLPAGRSQQSPKRWWSRESDMMAVFTESVKIVYYIYHHHVWP